MEYKFKLPIQIRFKDLDILGHVNASMYFTYFETTRLAFTAKVLGNINWNERGMVVVHNEMNYKKPIYMQDQVICKIGVIEYGSTSMKVGVHICKVEDNTEILCAQGSCTLVCVDGRTQQVFKFPEEWKQKINDFEKSI